MTHEQVCGMYMNRGEVKRERGDDMAAALGRVLAGRGE